MTRGSSSTCRPSSSGCSTRSLRTSNRRSWLEEEFPVENGFLTPTLKVKRRVVHRELDEIIDRLYDEEAADVTGP